ncbi:hypothetical protein UUU_01410 [Klebsiella pneumoniae subsp. pneumoniae DSM 30104 = JCM 1662 = NBRC 14940]|nr:hypothetical protein UUU_01410 [Klebsiella pneumoniae subsp. pneumoniae DSM 30104 = JCM 1662 = NBRC 14940]
MTFIESVDYFQTTKVPSTKPCAPASIIAMVPSHPQARPHPAPRIAPPTKPTNIPTRLPKRPNPRTPPFAPDCVPPTKVPKTAARVPMVAAETTASTPLLTRLVMLDWMEEKSQE